MKLDLYLNSKMVATTVERSRGRQVVLEYTDQVDRDHPPETALLSCSLPTPGPSRPAATRAFLEGLLPEGEALCTIASTTIGARLDLEAIAPAQRVFVTERFDRIVDGSSPVKRLHQEDMCQALGLRPRDKYQIGRPSQNMARLLRRWATDPARSVRELFSQLVFRAVVGDEDGHGKNYGLLLEGGKVALAPLYDCLSTQIYPSLAGRMGTQLGRQVNLAAVDLTALVEEGVACGIGESEATQLVDTLTDRILAAMQAISPPSVDVRALECVLGTIGLRVRRLREGKPMGVPPGKWLIPTANRAPGGTLDQNGRGSNRG